MNFEDFISSTDDPRPRKVVIYGSKGIGKTTLAAACPFGPVVFLPTEDGYQDIRPAQKKATSTGKRIIDSESELYDMMSRLMSADHQFNCVILDSITATEVLLQNAVAKSANKDSVADIGFKKGFDQVASKFDLLLQGFDRMLDRGMFVIIIAHATVEKFANPEGESFDYYSPRLDKRINPKLQEWADEVLFVNSKIYTKVDDSEGFGKKVAKGAGGTQRIIYTKDTATRDAKCRLELPDEINLTSPQEFWNLYSAAIKQPEVV